MGDIARYALRSTVSSSRPACPASTHKSGRYLCRRTTTEFVRRRCVARAFASVTSTRLSELSNALSHYHRRPARLHPAPSSACRRIHVHALDRGLLHGSLSPRRRGSSARYRQSLFLWRARWGFLSRLANAPFPPPPPRCGPASPSPTMPRLPRRRRRRRAAAPPSPGPSPRARVRRARPRVRLARAREARARAQGRASDHVPALRVGPRVRDLHASLRGRRHGHPRRRVLCGLGRREHALV